MGMTAEHYGLGKHIDAIESENDLYQAVKWDYVQSLPLGLAAMFTKISIFIFIHRAFLNMQTTHVWRWVLHFVNILNIAGNLLSATTMLAQCTPAKKLWDPEVPGTCWPVKRQQEMGIFQGGERFCAILSSRK
jgi:hypothetical protein